MVNSERGQMLPLFALVTPVMLLLMALGLDAAQSFVEKRNAQGAADLASLAGARLLHDDATPAEQQDARDTALAIAAENGYQASQVTVTTPYPNPADKDRILVEIDSDVDTFFLPILSLLVGGDHSVIDVDARAIAYGGYEEAAGGGFALFALQGCPSDEKTIDFSGSNSSFTGKVHSNSDLYLGGQNLTFVGPATHTCGSPSFVNNNPGQNTFDPAATIAPLAPLPEPDPINLRVGDFTCDYPVSSTVNSWSGQQNTASSSLTIGSSHFDASGKLRSGTYCSAGSIKIDRSNVSSADGGVTFVARTQVEISGSNFDLSAHEHGMLFVAFGTDLPIKISGSSGSWNGILYAPNGTAEHSGSDNLTLIGGVVAKRLKLNGSGLNIDGTAGGGEVGDQLYALVE